VGCGWLTFSWRGKPFPIRSGKRSCLRLFRLSPSSDARCVDNFARTPRKGKLSTRIARSEVIYTHLDSHTECYNLLNTFKNTHILQEQFPYLGSFRSPRFAGFARTSIASAMLCPAHPHSSNFSEHDSTPSVFLCMDLQRFTASTKSADLSLAKVRFPERFPTSKMLSSLSLMCCVRAIDRWQDIVRTFMPHFPYGIACRTC
jgi:hypothetical protein